MKVTREKTENSQAFLTIEMEPSEIEESMEKSYRRLVQQVKITGFRPGKAPRPIFERYFGRDRLMEEAIEQLVPDAYERAIKEQGIEAIARPQIEVTQTEPLVFKATVPLKPVVKLGDYRQVRVTPETPREVTDEDVDRVIDALRHQHAVWEPVEREVKSGDLLTIDIWSEVDGKPFINQKGAQSRIIDGDTFPVAGFDAQLIGMKLNEEKTFRLTFPADDPRKQYAGKNGEFRVRVNEIKQEVLPELNDDFAKAVSADFPTLSSLREKAAANLKERADAEATDAFNEKVLEAVTAQAEVEFPEVLVVEEIHRLIDQRFRTREQLEAYLKAVNKTEEELHTELHDELQPVATTRVRRSLVLGKIADEEKIEVTEAEIDADVERMLKSSDDSGGRLEKALNTPEVRETIAERLLAKKTLQRLVEIASGKAEVKS